MKNLKELNELVEYELGFYRKECNFTEDELHVFELSAKGCSNIRIATEISVSISTVYRIANNVKAKIARVDELYEKGVLK